MMCIECEHLDDKDFIIRDYTVGLFYRCRALRKWCNVHAEVKECEKYKHRTIPWGLHK